MRGYLVAEPCRREFDGWRRLSRDPFGRLYYSSSFFFFRPFAAVKYSSSRVSVFTEYFQLGRPFPLEIELSNSGRPAEGTLEIEVWKGGATKGGAPYPLYYRRDVFLSAQSRKTVQLTVDPDFVSRPLKITFFKPDRYGIAGTRPAALFFTRSSDSAGERRQCDSTGFARFFFRRIVWFPDTG